MKNLKKKKQKDFFSFAESVMSKKEIKEAYTKADKMIFKLKLAELRNNFGIKQSDLDGFSQVSVSRIESRNDIKISTLIDYIHACGLGLEIKAVPLKKSKKEEFILLKSSV
jgi:hypothetical protein